MTTTQTDLRTTAEWAAFAPHLHLECPDCRAGSAEVDDGVQTTIILCPEGKIADAGWRALLDSLR